jgi:hypothetical protein
VRRSKSLEVLDPDPLPQGHLDRRLRGRADRIARDAGGLSASTIGHLKKDWWEEHARWSKRDLSAKRYNYFWVDGIDVQARLEDTAQATPEGRKELCRPQRRYTRKRNLGGNCSSI